MKIRARSTSNCGTRLRNALVVLLAVASTAIAQAQSYEPQAAPQYAAQDQQYSQADLDEMLAPIALYPDDLLAQILMAASYPLEVVQAARWSRAHPDLSGSTAVWAVDEEDWDPSVKSLVAFPELISMMSERLDWTQRLGEAFLGQQDLASATVQRLRLAAYNAGNLRSSDEMTVQREGEDFVIDSPSPDMMYVPYYDPRQIYGPWWWPDAPVYWGPWPGYAYGPGFGFGWGLGIAVGGGFFFGDFDWRAHHVRVRSDRHPFYYHGADHRPIVRTGDTWRHEPDHRRGVPYRNPLLRQEFATAGRASDARREYRGHGQAQGFFPPPQQPAPSALARPRLNAPAAPAPRAVQPAQPPQVFEGLGRGQETRNFSARGQQSLQGRSPAPAASQPRPAAQSPIARPAVPTMRSAPPLSAPSTQHAPSAPSRGGGVRQER